MKHFLSGLLTLIFCAMPLGARAQSEAWEFGRLQRRIMAADEGRVLYRIDDELYLCERDLQLRVQAEEYNVAQNRALAEADEALTQAQPRKQSELLNEMIDELVLLCEAKALGVAATEEEAAAYLDESERLAREAGGEAAIQSVEDYIAGLGMSAEAYRERVQIPGMVRSLTLGRVKERLLASQDPETLDVIARQGEAAALEQFVQALRKKYPSAAR